MITKEEFSHCERAYREKGWFVLKLPSPELVVQTRHALVGELRRLTQSPTVTLENYHEMASDDAKHLDLHLKLTEFFRRQSFGTDIIEDQVDFFKRLIGPDLDVQSEPYLRITRPGRPNDTISFHRDTFYGLTSFELAVVIPFVDLDAEGSLSVIPGSHVHPESHYPTTQTVHPTIKRGSPVQKLGFAYAPKVMDPSSLKNLTAIPLRVGELLMFSSSLVHGCFTNQSSKPRWSCDIRVKHAFAPVDVTRRPDYYEPLSRSCVTEAGYRYMRANERPQAFDERAARPSP